MPGWSRLQAGPLSLFFSNGDLRRIRLGNREILRRIYAAVRDRNWDTVPGRIENLRIDAAAGHFSITYDSIHQQGDIDFRWRATLTGDEAGRVTFAFDGKAHSSFLRNRIGICVHHPLEGCVGRECELVHADGRRTSSVFPTLISPHQPFSGLSAISHEVAPGIKAEVRFYGEVFESEDHRNWTDANFKTYGTPLSLPFPVEVPEGTVVSQMVTLTLLGRIPASRAPKRGPVRIQRLRQESAALPRIGLELPCGIPPLAEAEWSRLAELHLSHLRIDLDLGGDPRRTLQNALESAARIGAQVEAAVTLPGPLDSLRPFAGRVRQWLIFHKQEKSSSESTLRAAREALGEGAVLAAGTNAYFAELNRNRPLGSLHDAVCFSINPQVHAFDNESIVENAAAQRDTIHSARAFAGGRPILVSPVTLRPRFNPNATAETGTPAPDPRQSTSFCAVWTIASLQALAQAGAASVTYYRTHGPGGVQDGEAVFPVFEVFRALAGFADCQVAATESSDPLKLASLLLIRKGQGRLLLANLTDEHLDVLPDTGARVLRLQPYSFRVSDFAVR